MPIFPNFDTTMVEKSKFELSKDKTTNLRFFHFSAIRAFQLGVLSLDNSILIFRPSGVLGIRRNEIRGFGIKENGIGHF